MNTNKYILKYFNYQYPLKNGYIQYDNDLCGINFSKIKDELYDIFSYDTQFDILSDWLYKSFLNKIIKIKYPNGFWEETIYYDGNGNELIFKDSTSFHSSIDMIN